MSVFSFLGGHHRVSTARCLVKVRYISISLVTSIVLSLFNVTTHASDSISAEVSPWKYTLCQPLLYMFLYNRECQLWTEGTWMDDPNSPGIFYACYKHKNPMPWSSLDMVIAKAKLWDGTVTGSFNWSAEGVTLPYNGCWYNPPTYSTLGHIETYNVSPLGGVTVRRDRTVKCAAGTNWDGSLCSSSGVNPYRNNQICTGVVRGVNPATGDKLKQDKDIPSTNIGSLELQRYYSSSVHASATTLGENWRHSYSINILESISNNVTTATLFRSNGNRYYFNQNSVQGWKAADPDINGTLQKLTDASGVTTGWVYKNGNDKIETYDIQGRLTSIASLRGNTETLSYDLKGRLQTVTDNLGRTLTFTYEVLLNSTKQRIKTITDYANRVYTYNYTGDILTSVDYPDGTSITYLYEDTRFPSALTGIIDQRGKRNAIWSYDGARRAISSSLAGGVDLKTVDYNIDGSSTITDSNNVSTNYQHRLLHGVNKTIQIAGPGCSSCDIADAQYTYNPITSDVTSVIRNGVITKYGNYDNNGNYQCKVEGVNAADTTVGECGFDPVTSPDAKYTSYTYDSRFLSKVITKTEPSVFTGRNKLTTYSYDNFGNTTLIRIDGYKPNGTQISRTYNMQYNGPLNQLTNIDGPRPNGTVNDVTTIDYYPDDISQGNNRAHIKRITVAEGIILRDNIQYTATGKVQSEYRPNGLIVSYIYYPGDDRLKQKIETSSNGTRVTDWTYLATGEVETITTASGTPESTTLTLVYDDARRLIRINDAVGNYIAYTLDTEGNTTAEKTYDKNGVLFKKITRIFDQYNHLDIQTVINDANDYNYSAGGTLSSVTNPNNVKTKYSYDDLKRLKRVTTDFGGIKAGTADTITMYGYDIEGRIKSIKSPNNSTTTYTYDDFGNLLNESSPDRGIRSYTYDAVGNMLTITGARNITILYSYDALNRVTFIDYPGTDEDVTFVYDTSTSCMNGIGLLCKIQSNVQTIEYSYDTFGNTLEQISTQQGKVFLTKYTYDLLNNIKTITNPAGRIVTYGRDKLGRILNINAVLNGIDSVLLDNITYTPDDQLTGMDFGNGHHAIRIYNGKGQLSSLSMPKGSVGAVGNLYPISNAGVDQTAKVADIVTLNGNASQDSDGSIVSYKWSLISDSDITVSITNSDKAIATFTAPSVSKSKTINFLLSVTDNQGAISNDIVSVTINPVVNNTGNTAPTGISLNTDSPSPHQVSTNVILTALGSGGSGPYEYRFYSKGPDTGDTWYLLQDFNKVNIYTWTPRVPGDYQLRASVRSVGLVTFQEATISYTINSTTIAPTDVSISTNIIGPQPIGTPVTFTGQGKGGTGPYEYRFYRKGPDTGNAWKLMQDYSVSNKYTLATAKSMTGSHTVQVNVRNMGSSKDIEAYRNTNITIGSTIIAATDVTISLNLTSPQPVGTPITFTSTGSGGSGAYEYRFWRKGPDTANTWKVVQNYSTSGTYTMTSTEAVRGNHFVQVNIRSVGSIADYEAYRNSSEFIIGSSITAPTSVTITSDLTSPQPIATPITFSAQGAGGTGPYEYRFWRKGPDTSNVWKVVQDYSSSTVYTITPIEAISGTHTVQVNVRNVGSIADFEAYRTASDFKISGLLKVPTDVTISTDVTSPQTAGAPITFTGQGLGGTGPYEYRFYRKGPDTGNAWTLVQDYSTSNTYALASTENMAGIHTVQVNVRNVGSSTDIEAYRNTSFTVNSAIIAPTSVTIATDVTSPQTAGAPITFTGQGVGGTGPYEYRFYRKGPDTGNAWTLVQNYSASNSYALATTEAMVGNHTVQVNVRNIGSSSAYEAYINTSIFTIKSITVAPTTVTINTDVTSPQIAGAPITFTGQGVGGSGPYEYRFYRKGPDTGNAWTLVQNYSASNSYILATTEAMVGTHTVQVNVRNVGSSTDIEAYINATATIKSAIIAPTDVTISASLTSPQSTGTPITFTAQSIGGTGPYEYRFWRKGPDTSNVWKVVQNYSTSNAYTMSSTEAVSGDHIVQVNARNVGSSADFEVYRNSSILTMSSIISSKGIPGVIKSVSLESNASSQINRHTLLPINMLAQRYKKYKADSLLLVLAYKHLMDKNNRYPMWTRKMQAGGTWKRVNGISVDYERAQGLIVLSEQDIDLWHRETGKQFMTHKHMEFDGKQWFARNFKALLEQQNTHKYYFNTVSHTSWIPTQTDASALLSENWVYTYDPNGNVETIIRNNGLAVFEYDALDRLIADVQANLQTWFFDYDRNGNRLAKSISGVFSNLTYLSSSNQLASIDGGNIGRNVVGNRISDRGGNRTFTYNKANRLYQVYEGGQLVATYYYNGLGQRVRKVTSNGTILYHYDLSGNLISDTDATGKSIQDYIYLDSTPVAQINNNSNRDNIVYLHTDHLSTPRRATDATGKVIWSWEGKAFGASIASEDPDGDSTKTVINLRFPGQYYDAETGLHYNYFRYYDPATGRYITSDPIGLQGGLNTYGYVGGNPTNFTDAFGLYRSHWLLRLLVPGQVTWDDALTAWENGNKGTAFALAGAMLGEQVLTVLTLGEFQAAKSSVQCLTKNATNKLNVVDDIVLSGGRSGSKVKNLTGPANSAIKGNNGRVFVTDSKGRVILDITKGRVKPVTPGKGFGSKRAPTSQELDLINKIHGGS